MQTQIAQIAQAVGSSPTMFGVRCQFIQGLICIARSQHAMSAKLKQNASTSPKHMIVLAYGVAGCLLGLAYQN